MVVAFVDGRFGVAFIESTPYVLGKSLRSRLSIYFKPPIRPPRPLRRRAFVQIPANSGLPCYEGEELNLCRFFLYNGISNTNRFIFIGVLVTVCSGVYLLPQ